MKANRILKVCAVAAVLALGAAGLMAQGAGGGQFGGGRGGFRGDPAQFRQRMMDNIRDELGFTNETDWNAVQPLVDKVLEARRDLGGGPGMMFRMMRRNRNGGGPGPGPGGRRFGPEPSPEAQALQSALDANAPAAQIKDALDKYRASQKDKQGKLEQAQENLKKVLTQKQEAQAVLMGLLD